LLVAKDIFKNYLDVLLYSSVYLICYFYLKISLSVSAVLLKEKKLSKNIALIFVFCTEAASNKLKVFLHVNSYITEENFFLGNLKCTKKEKKW